MDVPFHEAGATGGVAKCAAAALRAELTGRILGFVGSQAVYVAARLGLPDLLVEVPRTAAALADTTGTHPDALYRLLRLLAGHGIFVDQPDGRFANSALSELLRDTPA